MTDLEAPRWPLPAGVRARLALEGDAVVTTALEAERLGGYRSEARRRQSALGRTAARTLAGEALGVPPLEVALEVDAGGAPTVAGLGVSIAHTSRGGRAVAAAAVADRPVGVDLEAVTARHPGLWRRLLRPDEYGVLEALGGPTDTVQTLLWAVKEAVLKGQRTGFRAGAQSLRVLGVDGAVLEGACRVATVEAHASGRWRVAVGLEGGLWVAVAWRDLEADSAER